MRKIILMLLCLLPINVLALSLPNDIYSTSYLVYSFGDDEVILNNNADVQTNIASLTKILTVITAIDNIDNLDEKVTITSDILNSVESGAYQVGLKSGDIVTYRDLLYASIVSSGADATNAIAILSSGSVNSFVDKMNTLKDKLGCTNSHFVNTTGMTAINHYSSASDILKILKYALNNETFKSIYETSSYTLTNGLKINSSLNKYNTNLNIDNAKVTGIKTGFTNAAGYCVALTFKSNDHNYILVALNAQDENAEDTIKPNMVDSINIIKYINKHIDYQLIYKKGTKVDTIKLNLSKYSEYEIDLSNDIYLYLSDDYNKGNYKLVYDGINEIDPSYNGKLGTIYLYNEDNVVYSEDVIFNKVKYSYLKLINKYKYYIIGYTSLIIILVTLIKLLKCKANKR